LQIKEFRIMGLSINDSVYSCLFFILTGLHFFTFWFSFSKPLCLSFKSGSLMWDLQSI
jgi:heme/copper-type cytochrome/quinol oxidase subunit 3